MSRAMPPRGSKVTVDVFPEKDLWDNDAWSVEVGLVDPALHKVYGNPLLLDSGDDEFEARASGELFAKSEGYEIEAVRRYEGRGPNG